MTNTVKEHIEFKSKYDVIVIGAGVSGLTSAALLCKAGMSVLVLEKDKRVGGYLAGFRRKHFRFDTAIHWLNMFGKNGMASKIFNFLGNDWPHPVEQKRIRRLKSASIDYLITNNLDELRGQLISDFPEDEKGIIRFFKDVKQLAKFFEIYPRIFRSPECMSISDKIRLRWLQFRYGWPFLKHLRFAGEAKVEKGLKRYFSNSRLRSLFRMEEDILGCIIPLAWAQNNDFQNPPIGGSLVMPEWLIHVIKYHGGTVSVDSTVQKIDLINNQVSKVHFQHKKEQHSIETNYIIAACDVETLYEKMLPESAISKDFKKKLKSADLYSSSVTVSLSLDCTAESLGFNEEMVFLMQDGVSRKDHNLGDPEKCMISIIAPTLRDKSLSPEGTGVLTIYCAGRIDYNNYWQTERVDQGNYIRGEAYKKFKLEYAEKLIDRIVKDIAPSLRDHITFTDVATPVTHWRYTGNRDGSIMGASPGKKNIKMKLAHHQTQVKGLILGGHWSDYGGGVPIAVKTAANASLLILKETNKIAFKTLSKFMDGIPNSPEGDLPGFNAYDNSWIQELTPANKASMKGSMGDRVMG